MLFIVIKTLVRIVSDDVLEFLYLTNSTTFKHSKSPCTILKGEISFGIGPRLVSFIFSNRSRSYTSFYIRFRITLYFVQRAISGNNIRQMPTFSQLYYDPCSISFLHTFLPSFSIVARKKKPRRYVEKKSIEICQYLYASGSIF